MANLFGGLSTPSWMSPDEESHINFEEGQQLASNFMEAYNKAHQEQVQKPLRELQLQSAALDLYQQGQQIQLQQAKLAAQAADQSTIPNWLKDHPTWESRQNTDWPMAMTPEMEKQLDNLRLNDSRSAQSKAAVYDISDFSKRLGTINPTDRAAIRGMSPNKDGTPSEQQLMALGLAEQTSIQAKQNQEEQARIDAMARGDQQTTKITPKGIETTFAPKKEPKTAADANAEPQTKILPDGTVLAWMPQGNTIHVIHGQNEGKVLTPSQLTTIAKALPDDDPEKKLIMNAVKKEVIGQIDKKQAQPTPPGKNPFIVGKTYVGKDGSKLKYKGGDWNLESSWEKVP